MAPGQALPPHGKPLGRLALADLSDVIQKVGSQQRYPVLDEVRFVTLQSYISRCCRWFTSFSVAVLHTSMSLSCGVSLQGVLHYRRDCRELDLLVFQEVCEFVSRVDRVLSRPGGSLLLAGRSGVGRHTATHLVSHMHGYTLFTPKVSRGYSLKQFNSDLKSVRLAAVRLLTALYRAAGHVQI